MAEQTKPKEQNQDSDLENKARRGRGADARDEGNQGNRGGQQQAKVQETQQNEAQGGKDRGFESAGRGVRAKPGLEDEQSDKGLDSKYEEPASGVTSGSEDEGEDESDSNIGSESRMKKPNRDVESEAN